MEWKQLEAYCNFVTMRIIPVLDLMNGVVVRGIAGRRSEYRPLVSRLTPSCFPATVADVLHVHFGITTFYLADLDAIAGGPLPRDTVSVLHDRGYRVWLDAGVTDKARAVAVAECGVANIVVGLETIRSLDELADIVALFGERVVFSLDLKAGQPIGNVESWRAASAFDVAEQAVANGVQRIIVLDLLRVGVGEGTGTEALCERLVAAFPQVEISAGGGVRGVEDLHRLRDSGMQNVLVASALHDGRLTPDDLAAL
jgi:phosphoribosylformimino-5-aminoimidazole carboxamide ribotide isomerase